MAGVLGALLSATAAQAGTREASVRDRLQDRRAVVAGTRAYAEGFEDGRFYANGWHITGEMGGIWTPPLKLADGVWFGVDGQWVGQATKFTSGRGYTRYDAAVAGRADADPHRLRARRPARRAVRARRCTNPGAARTVTVNVDAHSELMGACPGARTPARAPERRGRPPGHRRLRRQRARLPRPGRAARRARPRLGGARRQPAEAELGHDRRRLPRPAARHGLRGTRTASRCRAPVTTAPTATAPAAS